MKRDFSMQRGRWAHTCLGARRSRSATPSREPAAPQPAPPCYWPHSARPRRPARALRNPSTSDRPSRDSRIGTPRRPLGCRWGFGLVRSQGPLLLPAKCLKSDERNISGVPFGQSGERSVGEWSAGALNVRYWDGADGRKRTICRLDPHQILQLLEQPSLLP